MKLPNAPTGYNQQDEQRTRSILETEDARNLKNNRDIEVIGNRLILVSPNGTRYSLTVANGGTIGTTML